MRREPLRLARAAKAACYSPAQMADADKRGAERVPILGELQGEIIVFQPMLILAIGKGGVTVETRFPLHLDSLHDLRLTLSKKSIVVKGRVAHSQISDVDQDIVTYRSGLEFVGASGRVLDAIREFLIAVKAGRSGSNEVAG
jgi:hypothetical protein